MTTGNIDTDRGLELGSGYLGWPIGERLSDRFGYIHLSRSAAGDYVRFDAGVHGTYGELWAVVVAPRAPRGRGDQIAGAGETLLLGAGSLQVYTDAYDAALVGIWPGGVPTSVGTWMDAAALYQIDDSLVTLVFVPVP